MAATRQSPVLSGAGTGTAELAAFTARSRHVFKGRIPVALLLASLVILPAGSPAFEYTYLDNFETDQAEADSYQHSPILDSIPDVFLSGILVYGYPAISESRALGFYEGFMVDANASLAYRMPLEENNNPLVHAQVNFAIIPALHLLPGMARVYFQASADGINWSELQELPFGSHVAFLPLDNTYAYFKFIGTGFALEYLNVMLEIDDTQPSVSSTWGSMKSLYR